MWKTTFKGLLAHKARLVSTFVAVMLGVSFIAGTFVLSDTLKHTFDNLFNEVTAGIDVSVRTKSAFDTGSSSGNDTRREPLPASLLKTVEDVPGVRFAEGGVFGYAQLVDKKGKAIAPQAPTFGTNIAQHDELSGLRIREGRKPQRGGEVAIDKATADAHGFAVGDKVTVLFEGPARQFTVVGIAGFGEADNLAGATMAVFDLHTAQQVLNRVDQFDSIDVAADDGVSSTALARRIDAALPATYEAVTGQKVADENADAVKEGIGFFSTFLLVFAFIALFVGAFIIFNTFSIIVAQRTREMALLRALGASRRQVTWSVLAEAFVVSLLASLVGLGLGVLVAGGLTKLLDAIGIDVPSSTLQFLPRTVVVSLVTGVVVTCVASLVPARKAGRVPPVAAMRDTVIEPRHSLRRRLISGGVVTILGNAFIFIGLFGNIPNGIALVGLGAMVAFIGVSMLSPVISRQLARIIGAPLPRLFGFPGRLARENAMRNPRRTASTASALMIGLGLVAAVSVMAASLKASVTDIVDRSLGADYVLETDNFATFSPQVAQRLRGQSGIDAASGVRFGEFRYKDARKSVNAIEASAVGELLKIDLADGSLDSFGRGAVLVDESEADSHNWKVGERIPMTFSRTGTQQVPIGATFKSNALIGKYLLSLDTFSKNFTDQLDFQVLVKADPDVPATTVKASIDSVLADFPNVEARDRSEFVAKQKDQVDQLLNLVYSLLALAIIIALVGIMNTMALSIFERTREIGLVRAVGLSRRQLRRTIRWESVVVSLLGAVLGLVIGVAFGGALVKALDSEGVTSFAVPIPTLVVMMVVAALAGMVAAILPARRAAKLDVLRAIATE